VANYKYYAKSPVISYYHQTVWPVVMFPSAIVDRVRKSDPVHRSIYSTAPLSFDCLNNSRRIEQTRSFCVQYTVHYRVVCCTCSLATSPTPHRVHRRSKRVPRQCSFHFRKLCAHYRRTALHACTWTYVRAVHACWCYWRGVYETSIVITFQANVILNKTVVSRRG